MRDLQRIQEADQAGGGEDAGRVGPVRPLLGSGVRLDDRECERHRPRGRRNRGQVVARSRHHLFVAGACGHKGLEGDLDVDGETCRASLVRLEAVPEAAVLVLVAVQGVDDSLGGGVLEESGEGPLFEDPGVGKRELPGLGEAVLVHDPRDTPRRPPPS